MRRPNPKSIRTVLWLAAIVAAAMFHLFQGGSVDARDNRVDRRASEQTASGASIASDRLPNEAQTTLALIKRGGPFPYEKDGTVFSNREKALPRQPRGYYTEYTVKSPGSRDRGARRIIAGGDPKQGNEFYYTDDHYQSFKRISN
jgi:ribonuclease T1